MNGKKYMSPQFSVCQDSPDRLYQFIFVVFSFDHSVGLPGWFVFG